MVGKLNQNQRVGFAFRSADRIRFKPDDQRDVPIFQSDYEG